MAADVECSNRASSILVSTDMHKLLVIASMMFLLTGCMLRPVNPNAPIATDIDPKSALNDYWFKKPAVVSVEATHIEALWNAAMEAAKERSFIIDRRDFPGVTKLSIVSDVKSCGPPALAGVPARAPG